MHFWPTPLASYEYLQRSRTESQLIHAHGWDLLSVVMDGELEERTYDMQSAHDGDFVLYETTAAPGRGVSVLRATEERMVIQGAEKVSRRPDAGVYSIASGTYHSTLPATRSTSVVAAKQLPGQTSQVAVYRGAQKELENAAPEQNSSHAHPHPESTQSDVWASFVFFARADQILLVRTVARPEQWHPVGGRRNHRDSSPIDTLIREAREETGAKIDPAMLEWLGWRKSDIDTGFVSFWRVRDYALQNPLPLPRREIIEARWWNIAEARELPMYQASAEVLNSLVAFSANT
ncbi:NUDIX hydrolase [Micromonospora sp. NPDC053740]|uniref:NUDIX hydrolase n=1 Tax=Micromonospora sp. NPDC053740 TaxID=3155173 RepID=UPI0034459776